MMLGSCRRDSQSRKTNSFHKCVPFSSQRTLGNFWTDIRFGHFPACRSGVLLVFQKLSKTNRFRRLGPARNRCASGLGSDLFFSGRSRERSVLDRFCSESSKTKTLFFTTLRIASAAKTNIYLGPSCPSPKIFRTLDKPSCFVQARASKKNYA